MRKSRCASALLSFLLGSGLALAQPTTLRVEKFEIEGNTLLRSEEMAPLLAPYQGKSLTLDEIKAVAEEVTRLHIARGYKLAHTYVPRQSFENGVVRLLVFEGKVGEVRVEGARYRSRELVERYFEPTIQSRDYQEDEVIRSLLLLNDLPDVRAKVRLEPGKAKGTTDLVVDVQDREAIGVWLSYNNYGSPAVGEHRAGLTVAAQDFSGVGDQLMVSTVLGFPARQGAFLDARYTRPLNTQGTRLSLGYTNSAFALGQQFEILDVRGSADIFTLSVDQALCRSLTHRSDVSFAVSSNSVRNSLLGLPFSRDEYVKATLGYTGVWLGVDGQTFLHGSVSQGWGTSPEILASRVGAGGDFFHANLDVSRVQNITPQFRWAGRAIAQVASQPLVTAEQFSVGGPYTVRGYPQGELLGDSAYVLSSEFRFSPLEDDPQLLELVAFIDHGQASLSRPQVGELGSKSLTGAGVGLRWNMDEDFQARLDLGFPVSPGANSRGDSPVIYAGLQSRLW